MRNLDGRVSRLELHAGKRQRLVVALEENPGTFRVGTRTCTAADLERWAAEGNHVVKVVRRPEA